MDNQQVIDKLKAACEAAVEWFYDPDADPGEQYERIGEMYCRDTGYLRPGKDDPGRDSNSEENNGRFREWCRQMNRERLAMLRDAVKFASLTPPAGESVEDYRKKYEAIVIRCRETKGRCFCGVHISEAQAAAIAALLAGEGEK